jgi:hypothetical protein
MCFDGACEPQLGAILEIMSFQAMGGFAGDKQ